MGWALVEGGRERRGGGDDTSSLGKKQGLEPEPNRDWTGLDLDWCIRRTVGLQRTCTSIRIRTRTRKPQLILEDSLIFFFSLNFFFVFAAFGTEWAGWLAGLVGLAGLAGLAGLSVFQLGLGINGPAEVEGGKPPVSRSSI